MTNISNNNDSTNSPLDLNVTAPTYNNTKSNGADANSPLWLAAYALINLLSAMQNQQIGNSMQLIDLMQNKKALTTFRDGMAYPPKPVLNGTPNQNAVTMQNYENQCQQIDREKAAINAKISNIGLQMQGTQTAGSVTEQNISTNTTDISNHISTVANLMFHLANICLAWTKLAPSNQSAITGQ
ncbi:MAG: hypothetical protein JHC93_02715 [Parachlamydiales bacterium]|nr:hypothetical protein [Parachlamydiales bacterium]